HRSHSELVCELARVQRAGAAEGDERESARIVAALYGDHAQRAQHLRVDNVDDVRRVDVAERTLGRLTVELDSAGEALWQASEQEVGVGHRRLRAAAPVARRPRVG